MSGGGGAGSSPEWLCVDVGFTHTRVGIWSGAAFRDVRQFRTIDTLAEGLTDGRKRRALWLDWARAKISRIIKDRPQVSRIVSENMPWLNSVFDPARFEVGFLPPDGRVLGAAPEQLT